MIIKTAFKNIARTPVKTTLFFLLLAGITVFLCLGASMWSTSQSLLNEADATFETTAVLEYIGQNYPDSPEGDPFMRSALEGYDYAAIATAPEVLSFERQRSMGGYIEGLAQSPVGAHRYKNHGIILFTVKYDTQEGKRCLIQKSYYSSDDYYPGMFFYALPSAAMEEAYGEELELELGHTYIAHGRFSEGANRALLLILDFPDTSGLPEFTKRSLEGFACYDVTDLSVEEMQKAWYFPHVLGLSQAYALEDQCVDVQFTSDLATYLEFARRELVLTEGRTFSDEEYQIGSEVCIISEHLAKQLSLTLGDTLEMSLYGSVNGAPAYKSYWPDTGFAHEGKYEIVGIFKEMYGYQYTVYVPANGAQWLDEGSESYTLARLRLTNGTAADFLARIDPLLLPNMRFTVYDQGYAETAAALKSMRETAIILTAVCAAAGVVLLMLFAHLYVAKQRDNVRIMLALGTGKARTIVYLMTGALLVSLLACAAGAALGMRFALGITEHAYARAVEASIVDFRFSGVYLGEGAQAFAGKIAAMPEVSAFMALGVFVLAALLCAFAAARTLARERAVKGNSKRQKRRGAGLKALIYPLKLALRSIARGGARSLVTPLVSLGMVALMCLFSGFLAGYENELDDVYENMPVRAYLTTYSGKSIDRLLVDDVALWPIMQTGFIKETHCSSSTRYRFDKVIPASERNNEDDNTIELPSSPYAYETLVDAVLGYESIVFTNDIASAPEFFYEENVAFTFLEGYSEQSFSDESIPYNALPCLMNSQFMAQNGIALGDSVRIGIYHRYGSNASDQLYAYSLDLIVAGTYPRLSGRDTIYVPQGYGFVFTNTYFVENGKDASDLSNWESMGLSRFSSAAQYEAWRKSVTFQSANTYNAVNFLLQNTRELGAFKDELTELGLSSVGKISRQRMFFVIEDQTFMETVNKLNRHISYMEVVYSAMYALSIGIGFILSYLLTRTRKGEFAIMRSTGAGAFRTFAAFFSEQALLCAAGTLLGGLAGLLMPGGIHTLRLWAILGYALCYCMGSALSVALMNRVNVLAILSSRD